MANLHDQLEAKSAQETLSPSQKTPKIINSQWNWILPKTFLKTKGTGEKASKFRFWLKIIIKHLLICIYHLDSFYNKYSCVKSYVYYFLRRSGFVCIHTWHPGIQYHNPLKHLQSYRVWAFSAMHSTYSLSTFSSSPPAAFALFMSFRKQLLLSLWKSPPTSPYPFPCHSSQCFTPSSWLHLQLHYPTPNPLPPAFSSSPFFFFFLTLH